MSTRYGYTVLIDEVDATAVFNKMGGAEGAKKFLAGELLLVESPKNEQPYEPILEFLVHVDRSVKPTYPSWVKEVMHSELECAGPAEYNLSQATQWVHDEQKVRVVKGQVIYNYLKNTESLSSCLNLQDGVAIHSKGITVFRKLFKKKAVVLWGSVVQDQNGDLRVPYLYERWGKIVLNWRSLDDLVFGPCNPALLHGK